MEPSNKKMKTSMTKNFKIKCLLPDKIIEDIPLVEVFIGKIIDKKMIKKLILEINSSNPIKQLQHLKRVKDNEIILALAETNDIDLKKLGIDSFVNEVKKCFVPSAPPVTTIQFNKATKLWPCNFHKNDYLEKLVLNNYDDNEIDCYQKWILEAFEIKGTIIFDPSTNTKIASATDLRHKHPLQHSIMLAIDKVSQHDSKSSTSYLCTNFYVFTYKEPCIMCAMALVHSRAKKVFFNQEQYNGAYKYIKLHTLKPLNHHYEVYEVTFDYV